MPLWISSITPPPRLLIISELDVHRIAKFSRVLGVTASYDFNKVSVITVNLNSLFFRYSDIKPMFVGSDRSNKIEVW